MNYKIKSQNEIIIYTIQVSMLVYLSEKMKSQQVYETNRNKFQD